jgi:triphosphatase
MKLCVPEAAASRIWELLAHYPHSRPVTRKLFSAYYDTPDGHLRARGVALRLRRQSGRWIQAIKYEGGASAGLHQRIEHEKGLAVQLPDLTALAQAGFDDLVRKRRVRGALGVAFTTEFARRSATFRPDRDTQIEVAVDRGAINAGRSSDPICEVELELKAGNPQALFALALELVRSMPARLDNRSKAERGYALVLGQEAAPVKASPSALDPDSTVDEAFVSLASQCIAHLQANEQGLIEGRDPEYLHQARVAIRRLRSLLRIFSEALPESCLGDVPEQFKALGHTLGVARNLDVLATETLAAVADVEFPGLDELRRKVQKKRRGAGRQARAAVAAPEYVALLLQFGAILQARSWLLDPQAKSLCARPCRERADAALEKLHRRALNRGRNLESLSADELHRLRIDIKRLRYAVEFFLPLAPAKARSYFEAVSLLQDQLGHLNDDAAAWRLLEEMAGDSVGPAFHQAIGFMHGWVTRDARLIRLELAESWSRFERAKRFWREPTRSIRRE